MVTIASRKGLDELAVAEARTEKELPLNKPVRKTDKPSTGAPSFKDRQNDAKRINAVRIVWGCLIILVLFVALDFVRELLCISAKNEVLTQGMDLIKTALLFALGFLFGNGLSK